MFIGKKVSDVPIVNFFSSLGWWAMDMLLLKLFDNKFQCNVFSSLQIELGLLNAISTGPKLYLI